MPIASNGSGAIPALTGLRFIAALMVFLSHYQIRGVGESLNRFMEAGYAGVTFFFVLSGFIITHNYLEKFEKDALIATGPYLWARFCRVYPLYFFIIIFFWLQLGGSEPVAVYLFALQSWHPGTVAMGFYGPAWSISVEAFLYVCFPILIPIFKALGLLRSKAKLIIAFIIIIFTQLAIAYYFSLPPRDTMAYGNPDSAHRWLYLYPLPRALDFSLGIMSAVFYKRFSSEDLNDRAYSATSAVIALAIGTLLASKTNYLSAFSWDASYAGLFAIFILAIAMNQKTVFAKLLASPRMVFLGEASFAFYMTHVALYSLFNKQIERTLGANIAFEIVFLIFVISVSVGFHITIEKPCQKYLRTVFTRRSNLKIAESATSKQNK